MAYGMVFFWQRKEPACRASILRLRTSGLVTLILTVFRNDQIPHEQVKLRLHLFLVDVPLLDEPDRIQNGPGEGIFFLRFAAPAVDR